jgi:hypothetical protein
MKPEDLLQVQCAELRQMAEENPTAIEVIVEMLIEAEEELCLEDAA